MSNDYIDDIQPRHDARKCTLCNSSLSMYNKTDQCFHHSVEDIEIGLREMLFAERLETHQSAKINLPLPQKEKGRKRWSQSDKIIGLVCDTLDVPFSAIEGKRKTSEITRARHITMYLLSKDTELSSKQIGKSLGKRDPSTVWYGVNKITDKLLVDDDLRHIIENLRSNYQ